MDALSAASAAESAERLSALPERSYNPFNLMVADSREAFLLSYREIPRLRGIEPGAHVIGNTDPDDPEAPKVNRILERAKKAAMLPRHSVLDQLASVCSEHDSPESPLGDACVHADGYGTRSSSLWLLAEGEPGARPSALLYADGPPCRTEYRDFTSLLVEPSP